jgi:hypothetical protein
LQKFLTTILLLSTTTLQFAQSVNTLMGARAAGTGYASSGYADEWSLFNNPGGIGKSEQINTAFAYEVRPQFEGANRMAAAINVPLRWAAISAGMFRFGDDLYSEQMISAGIGNQFGIASLGIKFNVIQYRSEGFGIYHAFSVDFGGITQLTDKIMISAYITNLNQAKINPESNERIPTRLTAGLSFKPDEHIFITSELSKDLEYNAIWRTGLEYAVYQKIFFRTGFNLNPNAAFFGVGAHKKRVRIDYAIQFNQLTGASHQASAGYWFGKNEKK